MSTQLFLFHWTDIHETYSQDLPWYVVVHKGWNLHLRIPTISYDPLLFFLYIKYIGKNSCQRNSFYTIGQTFTILTHSTCLGMCCAERMEFAFVHFYCKLCPFLNFPYGQYIWEKFLSTQLLLFHWTDIHKTSQYLPWYVVGYKGWNLHLHIPTLSNSPLLLFFTLNI